MADYDPERAKRAVDAAADPRLTAAAADARDEKPPSADC